MVLAMTRGRAVLVATAVLLGAAAGWGVGRAPDTCEQACPQGGICPTPPDCLVHNFNWLAALVVGPLVGALVVMLGLLAMRRR